MSAVEERISRSSSAQATARDVARGGDAGRRGPTQRCAVPRRAVWFRPSCATSTCTGLTGHGRARACGALVRFADDLLVMCKTAGKPNAPLRRCGDPRRTGTRRSRRPRLGSCICAKVGRAWTSSAFTIAGCAPDTSGSSMSRSSPAGPHGRQCNAPATGCGAHRTRPPALASRASRRGSQPIPPRLGGLLPLRQLDRPVRQDHPPRGSTPRAADRSPL